jgi:hypothetical protein
VEITLSNRRINLGIAQSLFLIIIQVFYGLTVFLESFSEDLSIQTIILYQVTFAYAYISILYLIRKILQEFEYLNKVLSWIIRLEALRITSHVFISLEIYYAGIIASICGIILFVQFLLCVVWFVRNGNSENPLISGLRPLIWSIVVCSVIVACTDLYLEYNNYREYKGILYFLRAIPFLFLFQYLIRIKSMPTANIV